MLQKVRLERGMASFFRFIVFDRKGATAIEYGLIAALISVALIAGATSLGGTLDTLFSNVANMLGNTTQ